MTVTSNKKAAVSKWFTDWYNGTPVQKDETPAPSIRARDNHGMLTAERYKSWKQRNNGRAFKVLYNALCVFFCLCMFSVLLFMAGYLPPFGNPENPAHNEVFQRYTEQGPEETGAVNIVAGMILDYRGFDTFGESCVLFTAVCAVLALLRKDERDAFDELLHAMEESTHDVILMQAARVIAPLAAVFGVYVVVNGHISPGGGFSGGAVLGAAMILYACSFGTIEARRIFSYDNLRRTITGALLFYAAIKGYSIYTGANGISSWMPLGTPGAILSSGFILPLNIAVGVIVSCTIYILYILFSKGEML